MNSQNPSAYTSINFDQLLEKNKQNLYFNPHLKEFKKSLLKSQQENNSRI